MSRTDAAFEVLVPSLGERIRRNVPLGTRTTYGVGGVAGLFVEARDVDDLLAVGRAHVATGCPVFVVGRGSNTLVADDGFAGIALSIDALDAVQLYPTRVTAGGGVLLPVLARSTAKRGLTGLEWAVGIPGTVGGGVRMNAGGHGSDIASCLESAQIVDLVDARLCSVEVGHLGLRFRGSALHDRHVVVSATFRVARGDQAGAEAELREVVRWRRENQPGGHNAGSVFVNPIPGQLSAGQVIDEIGLRGFRVGTAEVSAKHANFIQADEGGSAADVFALMNHVRERVLAERGIALRSENRLLGFGPVDWAGEGFGD